MDHSSLETTDILRYFHAVWHRKASEIVPSCQANQETRPVLVILWLQLCPCNFGVTHPQVPQGTRIRDGFESDLINDFIAQPDQVDFSWIIIRYRPIRTVATMGQMHKCNCRTLALLADALMDALGCGALLDRVWYPVGWLILHQTPTRHQTQVLCWGAELRNG